MLLRGKMAGDAKGSASVVVLTYGTAIRREALRTRAGAGARPDGELAKWRGMDMTIRCSLDEDYEKVRQMRARRFGRASASHDAR